MKGLLAVFLLPLTLASCVSPQQVELIEREQRRLRGESATAVAESSAARGELDNMRSSLADTRANLQEIQGELSALKEKVDEVRVQLDREIDRSAREGGQKVDAMEGRLAGVEQELIALSSQLKDKEAEWQKLKEEMAKAQEQRGGTTAGSSTEKLTGESQEARGAYEEAWRLLEQKDYRGAIARFREFLRKFPKSEFADNAQYWIAESYYAMKEFDQAILEFDAVRRKYPDGDKVPAALLKQGFSFAELGDKIDARLILQDLISRYPQSPEADKAKQRLKALGS